MPYTEASPSPVPRPSGLVRESFPPQRPLLAIVGVYRLDASQRWGAADGARPPFPDAGARLEPLRYQRRELIDAQDEAANARHALGGARDGPSLLQRELAAAQLGDVLNGADDLLDPPGVHVGLPRGAHITYLLRVLVDDAVLGPVERTLAGACPTEPDPLAIFRVHGSQERLLGGNDGARVVTQHPKQLVGPVHQLAAARPDESRRDTRYARPGPVATPATRRSTLRRRVCRATRVGPMAARPTFRCSFRAPTHPSPDGLHHAPPQPSHFS
jgi:hypothetical protein